MSPHAPCPLSVFLLTLIVGCGDSTNDDPAGGQTSSGTQTSEGSDDTDDTPSDTTAAGSDPTSDTSDETSPTTTSGDGSTGEGMGSTGRPPAENLFVNPSLEAWATAARANSYPDDWNDCGSGYFGMEAFPDACDGTPAMAFDGERYARAFEGEQLGQTVSTEPGETYAITFAHTAVTDCFSGTPSAAWEVVVDGDVVLTSPSHAEPGWDTATVEFVALGPSTEVCFRKPGGAGGIDDLSILRQ